MNTHKLLYQERWFALYADENGVAYIQCSDAAIGVALTAQGDVLLVREPSPPTNTRTLLLPGGALDDAEQPEVAFKRELQEEIGYKAGRIDFLGKLNPFKYLTTSVHVYLARNLTPSKLQGDEDYMIQVVPTPLASFETLIASGDLRDAASIAGLFLARRFLENETRS